MIRKKKTPEHVLARQRELYRIRKEKSSKLDGTNGDVKVVSNSKDRTHPTEKNRPWSKVTTRKTAPHILIKRKEQYYKKKALKALEQQNPQKRKSV